jgi:single-strand DNA-binding protein
VLVHGRLRVRAWESGPRSGTTVEIEAESAGHDLRWGTTAFTRARAPEPAPRPEPEDRDVPPPDAASPEPALAEAEAPAVGLQPHAVPAGAGWTSSQTDAG